MSEPRYCEHTDLPVTEENGRLVHGDGTPCQGPEGRIVHLIPAPGWRALFAWEQGGRLALHALPLAALALVEYCDGQREAQGLVFLGDSIAERVSSRDGFRRMLDPGEEPTPEDQLAAEEAARQHQAWLAKRKVPA